MLRAFSLGRYPCTIRAIVVSCRRSGIGVVGISTRPVTDIASSKPADAHQTNAWPPHITPENGNANILTSQNKSDSVPSIYPCVPRVHHNAEANSALDKSSEWELPLRAVHPGRVRCLIESARPSAKSPVVPPNVFKRSSTATDACHLLRTMSHTSSATEAWEAYHSLLFPPHHTNHAGGDLKIPYAHLHNVARLLASSKPRTRTLFLRLLSVLSTIHNTGGNVHLWEWNALIDCAGKGWRKTRPEDFTNALDVFSNMVAQKTPGIISASHEERLDEDDAPQDVGVKPDIVTYTTLLNIAARTLSSPCLQHATSLLKSSGLPPNRITHLSLLRYFTKTRQLSGVRTTLLRMKEQGLEVGLDGVNAVLWAFAYSNQMDVAFTIYRVLRHSVLPELVQGDHDIDAAIRYLDDVEGLLIPEGMMPNEVTYMIMIQTYTYHGDLIRALHVFMDMLSSQNMEAFSRRRVGEHDRMQSLHYTPTITAFRAIFLGFARHGTPPPSKRPSLNARLKPKSAWTLENLHALFKSFLQLPSDVKVPDRVIYWVLVAFGKTSGHDAGKLRKVWSQLEKRFGGKWGGRLERFRQKIATHEGPRHSV